MSRKNRAQTFMGYLPVFEEIKKLTDQNRPLIIAIEGRCGSGKSTLAALLKKLFDCNVFHMDDFFLPFDMKTPERLKEPGGNIHYERFDAEILRPLVNFKPVTYSPYNCTDGTLGKPIHAEFKRLTIVEGAYSMHPVLKHAYDYSIFLTFDFKVQYERILNRNGEVMLQSFLNKWIPMEEKYFSALNIQAQCDIVFDTSNQCTA